MRFRLQRPNCCTAPTHLNPNVCNTKIRWRSSTSVPSLPPRQLRSNFWIPQAELPQNADDQGDAGQLLIRAGYLRQAYSGIFHMLPLGLRVQAKLEALIDKHMQSLQASKVSLSSISSQKAWAKSGRLLAGRESEFLTFEDRHKTKWLLAPTHEEEITQVVKDVVHAPGHLPIRLYQVSRKYRDEKRPRGGLLRGREFLMKDLYTFDKTDAEAKATYALVRKAYSNLFDELRIPYVEARADSGNMGGSLSHEFHFPSKLGEDDLITCSKCGYAKNEEFVPPLPALEYEEHLPDLEDVRGLRNFMEEQFLSQNREMLVRVFATTDENSNMESINPFVVKEVLKDIIKIDSGIVDPVNAFWSHFIKDKGEADGVEHRQGKPPIQLYVFDHQISKETMAAVVRADAERLGWVFETKVAVLPGIPGQKSELVKKQTGDSCPECLEAGRDGELIVTKAIEVGHTFHLGDRYSSKFDLAVPKSNPPEYVSMGCHGIGVSRLIAASASALSDSKGLIWPRVIAPFEVLVVINKDKKVEDSTATANQIYDSLRSLSNPADVLIDDREGVSIPWKLKDADLIGYPVVVVLGRGWLNNKLVEIQCRRLNVKEDVPLEEVTNRAQELLSQL